MSDTRIGDLILNDDQKRWFTEARFGMFIHWGIYALAARHEWVKSKEKLDDAHYQRYFDHFDPDLYDPRAWARAARAAGMKYVVLTTKHHDGFCLWDSAATDYKVTNTPYGRDLLAPFVEAFRAEGLQVGFYYSIIDWHHPDFAADMFHPQRDRADVAAFNEGRDITRYAAYMRAQVTELLTQFGEISVIWYDFSYPDRMYNGLPGKGHAQWESEKLYALTRRLQPKIMINNRLDLDHIEGFAPDMVTPEQFMPREAPAYKDRPITWEGCHTFSGSWGYYRDETSWKSPEQLINILVDTVALGGNVLINVGPTARGTFDDRALAALKVYEEWMAINARAIYGAGAAAEFVAPGGCRFTQRGRRLYLHIQNWPFRHIHLDGLAGKVAYAQLLHDASEIAVIEPQPRLDGNVGFAVPEGSVTLELPVVKPRVVSPVVELFLK